MVLSREEFSDINFLFFNRSFPLPVGNSDVTCLFFSSGNLMWSLTGVPISSSISCFKQYISTRLGNRSSQALVMIFSSSSSSSKAISLGKHLRWYEVGHRRHTANCNSRIFLFSPCLQT
uniref:Uncharacterized protein LOC105116111 isoform X1 n=1 Tax=Rhizophora mucronata TaxID=61149 RepID=A0A2P2LWN7_RHIMU